MLDTDVAGQPALLVDALCVTYGAVAAARDVDLRVAAGSIVGLVGANGAGKTSVIDAITGFAPASSGSIRLGELDLTAASTHRRVHAGLARSFQNLELFDDLTVDENLHVAAAASKRTGPFSVELVLDRLNIGQHRSRTAGSLPAGDLRRVALARALLCQPAVLLLDEPAAGLDFDETAELGTVLRFVADQQVGILLVDHDMTLVLAVCDELVVLEFGEVLATGAPATVVADPRVREAYLGADA